MGIQYANRIKVDHSKFNIGYHYDTIEDGQKKKKIFIFYSLIHRSLYSAINLIHPNLYSAINLIHPNFFIQPPLIWVSFQILAPRIKALDPNTPDSRNTYFYLISQKMGSFSHQVAKCHRFSRNITQ